MIECIYSLSLIGYILLSLLYSLMHILRDIYLSLPNNLILIKKYINYVLGIISRYNSIYCILLIAFYALYLLLLFNINRLHILNFLILIVLTTPFILKKSYLKLYIYLNKLNIYPYIIFFISLFYMINLAMH